MAVFRSIKEPIRDGLTMEQLWKGADNGLIVSWEAGRKLSKKDAALANKARNGELPILGWKGGISANLKLKKKIRNT